MRHERQLAIEGGRKIIMASHRQISPHMQEAVADAPVGASTAAAGPDPPFAVAGRFSRTLAVTDAIRATLRDEHCCWLKVTILNPSEPQPCTIKHLNSGIVLPVPRLFLSPAYAMSRHLAWASLYNCIARWPGQAMRPHCHSVCPPVHLRTLLLLQACMITWRKIFTCRQGAFLNIQVFEAKCKQQQLDPCIKSACFQACLVPPVRMAPRLKLNERMRTHISVLCNKGAASSCCIALMQAYPRSIHIFVILGAVDVAAEAFSSWGSSCTDLFQQQESALSCTHPENASKAHLLVQKSWRRSQGTPRHRSCCSAAHR